MTDPGSGFLTEATRSSQRDCLLLWDELEAQWKELITLSKDLSGLAIQLLDVGQCLGSSYPDQVEKGECVGESVMSFFKFFILQ